TRTGRTPRRENAAPMSTGTPTKPPPQTAAEVCKLFPLGDEAKKLLRDAQTPRQYLDVRIEKQHYVDAARLLSHALPKRAAACGAGLCARAAGGTALPAPQAAAVQAAERWVADPSEANRRAAQAAPEAAGVGTPAGCAAMAAF